MANFENIEFSVHNSIANITLNRPSFANSINAKMVTELAEAALICDNDASIKVVLLTGNGPIFCAGGDLKSFASAKMDLGPQLKALADELHKTISLFARMTPVVVTAVNGMAAGAGFSLAIAGDYILAAESARFTMAYTAAGLTPDGSSTYYLPRLVGIRRAQELIFTNRKLTAHEALDWQLITKVVADDQLQAQAKAIAQQLASGPRDVHGTVKRLLLDSSANGLEVQMEIEGRAIANASMNPNGIEGIKAFSEKRKPCFV